MCGGFQSLKYGGIFDVTLLWCNMLLKCISSIPLISNLILRNDLVSEFNSVVLTGLKSLWFDMSRITETNLYSTELVSLKLLSKHTSFRDFKTDKGTE